MLTQPHLMCHPVKLVNLCICLLWFLSLISFNPCPWRTCILKAGIQGPKKWFGKCDKHYPSRFRQTSLATAVTNFTKPRTSHFFGLCIWGTEGWANKIVAKCDKHYPSRNGQTSLATAVTNATKPVTKINFGLGPSIVT